jgi:hypothetical protein
LTSWTAQVKKIIKLQCPILSDILSYTDEINKSKKGMPNRIEPNRQIEVGLEMTY